MISMTPAIVSRCRVFAFKPLTHKNVRSLLLAAAADTERGLGAMNVQIDDEALNHIVTVANGDVRSALNALELAALTTPVGKDGIHITLAVAEESIQKPVIRCDDTLYYDMLSAFCKSMRGSDSDAALFWFGRLLYAGADPKLLVRRINIVACNVLPESAVVSEKTFQQLDLFADTAAQEAEDAALEREKRRQKAVLTIRKKYGKNAILKGMNLEEGATAKERNAQIGGHKA